MRMRNILIARDGSSLSGELLDKSFIEIMRNLGEGHLSIALLLDFATAFGVSIQGAPEPPRFDSSGVPADMSFARRLGKRKV